MPISTLLAAASGAASSSDQAIADGAACLIGVRYGATWVQVLGG